MSKNKENNKVFTTLGASNHSIHPREVNDYYATDPKALRLLLDLEKFSDNVWECACGGGHLSEVLKAKGYKVRSSDIIDRGYKGTEIKDFLSVTKDEINGRIDIITNPPYKFAKTFVQHALDIVNDGTKVAMFLKLQFLEGQSRQELFEKYPPQTIYVSRSRLLCAKNGKFEGTDSSAIAYCWFIWEKGYEGPTVVDWFN